MYPWKLAGVWMKTEVDWKQTGSRLEVDWKQTGSRLKVDWKKLEVDWKQTGIKLEETGTKVVVMNHLSFQHHDVKKSSMKGSRFEINHTEIKTTKHFQ